MRRTLLAATTLLLLAAAAPPAHAAGRPGTRVSVTKGPVRSTVALNVASALHAPLRLQPPEEEDEEEGGRPEREPGPAAPARADGGPRRSAGTATAFSPAAPLAFDGPGLGDAGAYPPDTQGDVGPTQFIAMINGRLRSYSKATGLADGVLNANTDAWWAPVMTPVATNFTSDPRIRYDRLTDRWYAVMIDVPNDGSTVNRIMIAVSSTGTITGATTWSFFSITGNAGEFTDYPTLGIDNQALYIGTNQFTLPGGSFAGSDGYVVRKSTLLAGGPVIATRFDLVPSAASNGPYTPQGVDNADPTATAGYFIGVDNLLFSRLVIRRVLTPGGTPTISGDLNVAVPQTRSPTAVANSGGITLDALDDRLFAAQMRSGHIWTAHNIAVDASGAAATGGRTASRWYDVDTGGPAGTPSLTQSGTVFDPAAVNPRAYWIPSVAVNGRGTMLIAGSTAAANTFVDAWYAGRRAQDAAGTVEAPTRYSTSASSYAAPYSRWGDYSLTRVDPTDDLTLWTIQEYVSAANTYGTRIARLRAPAPATPASASVVVPLGQASTTVTITGTSAADAAFFDPGNGFSSRFGATVGCGVTVNSATVVSATSLTLDVDSTGATKGLCPVTATNPDGQAATSAGGIVQTDGRPQAADDGGTVAQDAVLEAPSVLGNDSDPDADALTASLETGPAHGDLTLRADGTFAYTPTPGYHGADAFTYRAGDGLLTSAPATVSLTVTPAGVPPGAPTAVTATPGDGSATVAWSAPASAGDSPITSYLVTASPGGATCAWSSGPLTCVVAGLVNGTPTTFTVMATNGAGPGPASLPSAAVTPVAPLVVPPVITPPVVKPPGGDPALVRTPRAPARLRVLRARVRRGRLDVLAQLTGRAAAPGAALDVRFRAAGATTAFRVPLASAARRRPPAQAAADLSVRIARRLPARQRRSSTGIVELRYAGSASVQPDAVRLRAANGRARLRVTSASIGGGRLRVAGTIAPAARGVIGVRLAYDLPDATSAAVTFTTPISGGAWSLDRPLPAAAAAGGQLTVQFTGYRRGRLRGEQASRHVGP